MHLFTTSMATTILLLTASTKPPSPSPSHNITSILSSYPEFTIFNHHLSSTGSTLYPSPTGFGTSEILDIRGSATNFSFTATYTSQRPTFLGFIYQSDKVRWTDKHKDSETILSTSNVYHTDKVRWNKKYILSTSNSNVRSLAVIHVSTILPSPAAESIFHPIDLRHIIASVRCKISAHSLTETPEAKRWYMENAYAGMTIFCPIDRVFEGHMSRFEALQEEEKIAVFLYHALPDIYYNKQQMRDSEYPDTLLRYYCKAGLVEKTIDIEAMERVVFNKASYVKGPLTVYPIKGMMFPGDRKPIVTKDLEFWWSEEWKSLSLWWLVLFELLIVIMLLYCMRYFILFRR